MIEVCPGYEVTEDEYQERYDGIDLEHYRKNMTPELFAAFVRGIGLVEAIGELDGVGERVPGLPFSPGFYLLVPGQPTPYRWIIRILFYG